ncbi:TPA: Ti-type conjugative transfer relaxase TraA [Legionella pneumophila]|nr:Ti-type conjugative transfer relaxase TraA [Legionella pneumophila]
MAIAFAQVSIHTRSKGHSAIAASSYRSGTKLFDSRTGVTHDYSKRHGVVYSEILLPEGSDAAFAEREYLWNQVELAEKRRDAQLCKDIVLALPRELNLEQHVELTKRFTQTHFVDNGLPADLSIHDDHDGNPHAHILVTTRRLEQDGFSKSKARDLNPAFAKGFIVEKEYWGERWREMQNEYFIEKEIDLVVDLDHLISERHHGKLNEGNEHYLLDEKVILQQARQELALNDINKVISHISSQHSVFTRRDVEKLLFKTFQYNEATEQNVHLIEQIMSHAEVIELGKNKQNQISYTTREQYRQEAKLRDDIESMMKNTNAVNDKYLNEVIRNYTLSEEQLEAVHYVTKGKQISVVIGRPGTGKSYLLQPIKEFYQKNEYRVLGAALSGKVAKSLQTDTGIPCSTIASLTYKLTNQHLQLTNKDVLVIDEAGMADFNNMAILIKEANKAGTKVILVGDPDQLKPIFKGEIFRGIAAYTGYIELENIKRQNDLGDRLASMNLAKGHINEVVDHYSKKGAVHFYHTSKDAAQHLILDWQFNVTADNLKDSILLAYARVSVAYLNEQARTALKEKHILSAEEVTFKGFEKELKIAVGERVLFRENDKTLAVRNGDIGTVLAISKTQLDVKLDSGEILKIPNSYKKMDYGYALTVHKSQGMTVKHAKVLIDSKYWDRNLSFVAMTRHKETLKIYADSVNHPTMKRLKETLSRSCTRDNVIDWPLDFATRAGFNPDQLIGRALNQIAGVGHKIKNVYNYVVNYEAYLVDSHLKEIKDSKETMQANAKDNAARLDNTDEIKSQTNQQNSYKNLLEHYPLLAEYQKLQDKRKHLNGYFAEKLDKQIIFCAKKLSQDKELIHYLTKQFPEVFNHMNRIIKNEKVHYHE